MMEHEQTGNETNPHDASPPPTSAAPRLTGGGRHKRVCADASKAKNNRGQNQMRMIGGAGCQRTTSPSSTVVDVSDEAEEHQIGGTNMRDAAAQHYEYEGEYQGKVKIRGRKPGDRG